MYFLCKNAQNTNFYQFFSIFANFYQFRPNFGASLFFPFFFQLIITYHVSFFNIIVQLTQKNINQTILTIFPIYQIPHYLVDKGLKKPRRLFFAPLLTKITIKSLFYSVRRIKKCIVTQCLNFVPDRSLSTWSIFLLYICSISFF